MGNLASLGSLMFGGSGGSSRSAQEDEEYKQKLAAYYRQKQLADQETLLNRLNPEGVRGNLFGSDRERQFANAMLGTLSPNKDVGQTLAQGYRAGYMDKPNVKGFDEWSDMTPEQQEAYREYNTAGMKGTTYGTTPYFDSNGNAYVMGNDGVPKRVDVGLTKPKLVDTGSGYVSVNTATGQQIVPKGQTIPGTMVEVDEDIDISTPEGAAKARRLIQEAKQTGGGIKKDLPPEKKLDYLSEAEKAKSSGKAAGEKLAEAPSVYSRMDAAVDLIDEMLLHPGLDKTVGMIDSRTPTFLPRSVDFKKKEEQLTGKVYLEARQLLEGQGQVTEQEANAAAAAETALSNATSEEEYRRELRKMKAAIQRGMRKLRDYVASGGEIKLPEPKAATGDPQFDQIW